MAEPRTISAADAEKAVQEHKKLLELLRKGGFELDDVTRKATLADLEKLGLAIATANNANPDNKQIKNPNEYAANLAKQILGMVQNGGKNQAIIQ